MHLVNGQPKSYLQINKAKNKPFKSSLPFHALLIIALMKKFKFENANKGSEIGQPAKVKLMKEDSEKDRKREQLERQMKMLQGKIGEKDQKAKQAQKLLNIDEFLKKQKEKTREYALKLNEEYDREKKERQAKLYKKYNRPQNNTQKLITSTSKNQIPLNVYSAIHQLKSAQNPIAKWILDDHHYKLNDLVSDTNRADLFSEELMKEEESCLKGKGENGWKRMKELCTGAQIKYLPVQQVQNELQPNDQGQKLMSVLTLMPKELSEYLYNSLSVGKQEYFLCRFYPGGQKKSVITDQRVEVHEYTHKYININSRHKKGLIFWSSLLQKAYKKLFYRQITPNLKQTIHLVYGLDGEFIPFNSQITIRQNFFKVLNTLISYDPKSKIAFLNDRKSDNFYPLLNIELVGEGIKNKNKKKEQQVKKQALYCLSNPYTGILKSDFVNKFTLNQLFQHFNRIVVLRQYPQKWAGVRIKVQFLSNGALSFTSTQWMKNNQYSFTLTKATEIRMILRRSWGTTYQGTKIQDQKLIYGFVLFKSGEGETQISSMKLQNLVTKSKSSDENRCSFNKLLEKGTYILIPFSHYISQQYTQSFNLDILAEREENVTINKAKIYQYYYENKEARDEKVIQKLQSRVKYEKPKYEKIKIPKLYYHSQEKTINEKYIQSLGLALNGQTKPSEFFIPGKLKGFLVSGEVKQEKKEVREKKSEQEQQVQKYERQQGLKIMLGYDALDQQINHGEMMALVNESSDEIDLANYGLGEQGLMGVMQALMSLPRLTKLNLSSNDLNDTAIIYLCYYLQKGNRNQLRVLDVSSNKLGKSGIKALKGLQAVFKNLSIAGLNA